MCLLFFQRGGWADIVDLDAVGEFPQAVLPYFGRLPVTMRHI